MNERIRELAKQANVKPMYSPQGFDPRYLFEQEELEKFAELIVKECAEFVENDDYRGITLAGRLRLHFGVEE